MSLGNDKNNLGSSGMSNQEIRSSLISIYDKINKPPTKEVGYDLFLKLVHRNLYFSSQMNFIINNIGEFITPLTPKEKDPCVKLLSLIFYSPSTDEDDSFDLKIYYPFLSPVLSILQNLIKDTNSPIFPTISNIYAEIVQNVMPTDIEVSNIELDQDEKTAYEMLQGFCFYNMKCDDKSNRVVGSLCLTKLVENCPIVLQKQYMKIIWEVIMSLIDKKNYNAKYELLNCLISLILGAENLFAPYAHSSLYKVLDFLADTDWLKRKLALNVIYTLIFYCKEEILPLKDNIIGFLRALKTDKVKEVREVCLLILKIFSENEQKSKDTKSKITNFKSNKNNDSSKPKLIKPNNKVNKNKERPAIKKNLNKSSKNLESEKNNFNKNSNKYNECVIPDNKDINDKNELNMNNTSEENTNLSNKNKDSLNIENNSNLVEQESNINLNLNNNRTSINNPDENLTNNNSSNKIGINSKSNNLNEQRNSIKDNNDICALSQTKFVNRKDDKTFINEKMVIKPDPKKSIFKSIPNPAFFNQANKKSNDIVIVSKGEQPKINSINNNNDLPMMEEKGKNNKKDMNKDNDINVKVSKIINKKENSKKVLFGKKDKQNNDSEAQDKKVINKQIDKNNNNIQNEIKKGNEYDKKEKEEKPHINNKFAPLIKSKIEVNEGNKKFNDRKQNIESKINDRKNDYKNNEYNHEENMDNSKMDKSKNKFGSISKNKDSENKTYDPNIINTLLSQMNSLSEKQLSLIDIVDNVHMETKGQIKDLNKKLSKLERYMEDLNNELYYIKNDN